MTGGWFSCVRFIPADAGNTLLSRRIHLASPVYPRWRGEHTGTALTVISQSGLSPLARGTLCGNAWSAHHLRFIPAGAGNTVETKINHFSTPVYPRWRGEHVGHWRTDANWIGLSPLARGTPVLRCEFTLQQRFIPAGAGNTIGFNIDVPPIPVYPRWRGEHMNESYGNGGYGGLSPLARGTR